MGCNFAIGTYRLDGSPAFRPCGKCLGCRLEYSRQWAMRSALEMMMHPQNCFVTLTYNDDHLPLDKSLDKEHFKRFIRRFRKKIDPTKIRFIGCGEYGEKLGRPHYHAIIFGYDFPDKKILQRGSYRRFRNKFSSAGEFDLYKSSLLAKIWEKGFVTIGEANWQTAAYVARYVTKKVTGKKASKHYNGKQPEFALHSRMPGIGKPWYDKYYNDVYPKGYVQIDGRRQQAPKYFDSLYAKSHPQGWEKLKKERRKIADKNLTQNNLEGYSKERAAISRTKRLERKLHR